MDLVLSEAWHSQTGLSKQTQQDPEGAELPQATQLGRGTQAGDLGFRPLSAVR